MQMNKSEAFIPKKVLLQPYKYDLFIKITYTEDVLCRLVWVIFDPDAENGGHMRI